jgi:phosphohistidine phosphatase
MLGLFRHAKSDWDDLAKRDFDRGLNERGRRGARLMGDHIRSEGTQWDRLLASPAERVRRTLQTGLPGMIAVWDERLYLASASTIFDVVREDAGDADAVLVAGHNPGMQEALFALVAPDAEDAMFDEAARKFPTAAFAVFQLDIDDWNELDEGCGRLVHFKRPRDLDPALGPED